MTLVPFVNISAQKEARNVKEGNKQYVAQKFTEAQKFYEQGIADNSDSYSANFNLGNSLFRQKKYKEALEQYQKAATLTKEKKEIASAFHNVGNALMEEKNYEKSVEAYKNSLKANPKDDDTRYNLAVAQYLMKKQQEQQKQQQQQQKQEQQKQEQQKQEQQQEQQKQEQKQQQQPKMQQEQIEQILKALEQDERDVQERRKIQMGQRSKTDKEW
ncbi:MAG: tetratricopeptide repeat protein [Bacteroidetes bacterium]|nr:MAG: tetratricopeptide repeat protein [Bacteroidota bacterium]